MPKELTIAIVALSIMLTTLRLQSYRRRGQWVAQIILN
jgi:hypothetical protein